MTDTFIVIMFQVTIMEARIDKIKDAPVWWEDDIVTIGNGKWIGHKVLCVVTFRKPHSFQVGQEVQIEMDNGKTVLIDNGTECRSEK